MTTLSSHTTRSAPIDFPNCLRGVHELQNEYYVVRYALAGNNCPINGGLVSNLNNDGPKFGITEEARKGDMRKAAVELWEKIDRPDKDLTLDRIAIVHSPFLRTTQSAQVIKEVFDEMRAIYSRPRKAIHPNIKLDPGLRVIANDGLAERRFGGYDLKPHAAWQEIRNLDIRSKGLQAIDSQAETARDLQVRVNSVIEHFEKLLTEYTIILVTHGDVAQMFDLLFSGATGKHYSEMPQYRNCEFRQMQLPARS